jgi:hypothetical protein
MEGGGHVQEDAGPEVWVNDLQVDLVTALGARSEMVNALRVRDSQVSSGDSFLKDGEDRTPCYQPVLDTRIRA